MMNRETDKTKPEESANKNTKVTHSKSYSFEMDNPEVKGPSLAANEKSADSGKIEKSPESMNPPPEQSGE